MMPFRTPGQRLEDPREAKRVPMSPADEEEYRRTQEMFMRTVRRRQNLKDMLFFGFVIVGVLTVLGSLVFFIMSSVAYRERCHSKGGIIMEDGTCVKAEVIHP